MSHSMWSFLREPLANLIEKVSYARLHVKQSRKTLGKCILICLQSLITPGAIYTKETMHVLLDEAVGVQLMHGLLFFNNTTTVTML